VRPVPVLGRPTAFDYPNYPPIPVLGRLTAFDYPGYRPIPILGRLTAFDYPDYRPIPILGRLTAFDYPDYRPIPILGRLTAFGYLDYQLRLDCIVQLLAQCRPLSLAFPPLTTGHKNALYVDAIERQQFVQIDDVLQKRLALQAHDDGRGPRKHDAGGRACCQRRHSLVLVEKRGSGENFDIIQASPRTG
jgi:hypothetical protein